MKIEVVVSLTISAFLLLGLATICAADTITFEPHDEEEEPYLINGGTHDFDRMVADFGAGFNADHFRFADGAAFWVYKFEFDGPATATAIMDISAEFKVSIGTSNGDQEPDYVVVFEEENHVHDRGNREDRTIEFSEYFENPGNTIWIKFEDSIPADGWGAYLDSFTLEYTVGHSVKPAGKFATTWSRIKTGS